MDWVWLTDPQTFHTMTSSSLKGKKVASKGNTSLERDASPILALHFKRIAYLCCSSEAQLVIKNTSFATPPPARLMPPQNQ